MGKRFKCEYRGDGCFTCKFPDCKCDSQAALSESEKRMHSLYVKEGTYDSVTKKYNRISN